jgi:hypothetical protein
MTTQDDWSRLYLRAIGHAAEAAADAAEAAREGKLTVARDLLAEAVRHLGTAETRASRMAAPGTAPTTAGEE